MNPTYTGQEFYPSSGQQYNGNDEYDGYGDGYEGEYDDRYDENIITTEETINNYTSYDENGNEIVVDIDEYGNQIGYNSYNEDGNEVVEFDEYGNPIMYDDLGDNENYDEESADMYPSASWLQQTKMYPVESSVASIVEYDYCQELLWTGKTRLLSLSSLSPLSSLSSLSI